jgi:hypothetical protein
MSEAAVERARPFTPGRNARETANLLYEVCRDKVRA